MSIFRKRKEKKDAKEFEKNYDPVHMKLEIKLLSDRCDSLQVQLNVWEKEAAYWKEKALQEIENIKFSEDFSEKKIRAYKEHHRRRIEEEFGISVWYNPDCGCNIDIQLLLDRYPMSPKIHSQCPQCKKGALLSITDPIIFYNPIEEEDFEEKDIGSLPSYIRDSFQDEWLTMYFYQYAARSRR